MAELDKAGKLPEGHPRQGRGSLGQDSEGNDAPDNLIVKVIKDRDGKRATESSTVKADYAVELVQGHRV